MLHPPKAIVVFVAFYDGALVCQELGTIVGYFIDSALTKDAKLCNQVNMLMIGGASFFPLQQSSSST